MPSLSITSTDLTSSRLQDWLYEDGEDATKAAYIAKMDEIRFVAGPIIQRFNDKLEAERQAILKREEEAAAKKKAELDAKKAAEDAKKAAEQPKEDSVMEDADGDAIKPDSVDEPADEKK